MTDPSRPDLPPEPELSASASSDPAPSDSAPSTSHHRHRPHLGSMSTAMLRSLLADPLDPGYAAAAKRRAERAAGAQPPARRVPLWAVLAATLTVAGLLFGIAYQTTSRSAPGSERARQELVDDIRDQQEVSASLQTTVDDLRAEVAEQRDQLLASSDEGTQTLQALADLESAAAQTAVTGPGVTVTVGDADTGADDPLGSGGVSFTDDGRIMDRDLQDIVNALWAAGAEAISVDDERLAAGTPIRAAGGAILVDFRPVSSPYTIHAIGDPDRLLPRFADTDTARRFTTYRQLYGITFEAESADSLTLDAAGGAELYYAEAVPTD